MCNNKCGWCVLCKYDEAREKQYPSWTERLAYAGEVIANQNTTILNLRGEIAGLEKKIKELEKAHDPH